MVCIGKFAAQNDVTIQKTPNGIRNRFVHVVALDQNRVYCGYCPAFACTRPLQQTWQHGEDRRHVTTGSGRLTGGQAYFPLSHGKASQRVHQQENFRSFISKALRQSGGQYGCADPHGGGLIGSGNDYDRFGHSLGAQVVFDEFPKLSSSLTYQGYDVHVRLRSTGNHPQKN